MADGVVILPSYHEAVRTLPDNERLNAYDAIMHYGLYGEIIEMTPTVKMLFSLIKPTIDSSQNRYRAAKVNGGKPPKPGSNPRGRPARKNQTENQRKNQTENQEIDIDSDLEDDSDIDIESATETDNRTGSLPPPSKAEVELFLYQNKIYINPDRFYYFCENIGWSKIWDWRNLAKSWDKNELKKETNETYLQFRLMARERGLIHDG